MAQFVNSFNWAAGSQLAIMLTSVASLTVIPGYVSPVQADAPIPVAHCGLLRHAPENTLRGCDFIGWDRLPACQKYGESDRLENGSSRSIRGLNLNEVLQLDAGSWFDPAFTGVQVPTLKETLALVKARKRGPTIIALNVKQLAPAGQTKLVSLVEKYGLLDDSFAFDQNAEISQRLKKLNPKFRIGQNVNRQSLDDRIQEDFLDVFLLTFASTREDVERLHQRKKQVLFNYAGIVLNNIQPVGLG